MVTGFDRATFRYIFSKCSPMYADVTPYSKDGTIRLLRCKKGRVGMFDSILGLALALLNIRSRGSNSLLQMVFGATRNIPSLLLRFGRRVLLDVLKAEPNAQVVMPIHQRFNLIVTRLVISIMS